MSSRTSSTVCLLIHGYLGTPFEMQPLAAPLEALGLQVRLLTLPGHNSNLTEFRRTGFADWRRYVEAQYDLAAGEYERVILIGFSLGGTLALHLAESRRPFALVALAAPVFPLRSAVRQLAGWLRIFLPLPRFLGLVPIQRPGLGESQEISPWQGYRELPPVSQWPGLLSGFRQALHKLGLVNAPILIVQDVGDKVVNVDNALVILAGVASERCELEITRMREQITVRHLLTTHRETGTFVINRVRRFIASVCGMPRPEDWPPQGVDHA